MKPVKGFSHFLNSFMVKYPPHALGNLFSFSHFLNSFMVKYICLKYLVLGLLKDFKGLKYLKLVVFKKT